MGFNCKVRYIIQHNFPLEIFGTSISITAEIDMAIDNSSGENNDDDINDNELEAPIRTEQEFINLAKGAVKVKVEVMNIVPDYKIFCSESSFLIYFNI